MHVQRALAHVYLRRLFPWASQQIRERDQRIALCFRMAGGLVRSV